ncbi:MAG: PKD domain-containing protein [Bacteroidetes bacterium]|nr:PKD domain-containing protein [Bacteroidota bacterium]
MKRLLPIVVFLFFTTAYAQKRAMNWYFGKHDGLAFNTAGESNLLSDGHQDAFDACVSLSDLSGNLLLYSDGDSIWNRNHEVIQNCQGIQIEKTATQGALLVPQPGSKSIYYLFTLDDSTLGKFNLKYSVIDMSLNNGKGAVTSDKNVALFSGVTERMAATYNNTGNGVWIAVRDAENAQFYSFLLNSSGVGLNPVSSSVGSSTSTTAGVSKGQMKFSPDGSYLAWACKLDRFVELLKFNKVNGTFENWSRKITFYGNYDYPYGVEFSSKVSYLYVSLIGVGIYQYDLGMVMSESLFNSSGTKINNGNTGIWTHYLGMQSAPDGKIYISSGYNTLHVIDFPNNTASSCNFEHNAKSYTNAVNQGLPNFISNYFVDKKIVAADTCVGDSTSFTFLLELGDSLLWNFGDFSSSTNLSRKVHPKHVFSQNGKYDITLYVFNGDGVDTLHSSVTINAIPDFTLGPDTIICGYGQYLLNPGVSNAMYRWQDGKTTPVYAVKSSGTYSVKVDRYGCLAYDTAVIEVSEPSTEIVLSTGAHCSNNNVFNFSINQSDRVASVIWNFGDGNTSTTRQTGYSYNMPGTFEVKLETVNDKGCKATDNIQIEVFDIVKSQASVNQESQCFTGNQFVLQLDQAGNSDLKNYSFLFSDAAKVLNAPPKHSFANAGEKWVQVITTTVHDCKDTTTISLHVLADPIAQFTIDSSLHCETGNKIILNDITKSQNGSITSRMFESEGFSSTTDFAVFHFSNAGEFIINLQVEDSKGCKGSTSQKVQVYPNPQTSFSFDQSGSCIGNKPIQLNNESSISKGNLVSYAWDFGDGTTNTHKNPVKKYTVADAFEISLTTTSDQGCTSNKKVKVETYEAPIADFDVSKFEPCMNENMLVLENLSSITDQSPMIFQWEVDGVKYQGTKPAPIHFDSYGPKQVSLTATSNRGCKSGKQLSYMILPSPMVNFEINEPEQCENGNLFLAINTSDNPISPIVDLTWSLSDGRTNKSNKYDFSFPSAGEYQLELQLTNQYGCESKAHTNVTVNPQPVASFEAEDVCLSSPMQFVNNSSVSSGQIVEYWWNFGDKATSKEFGPQHKFDHPGEYGVYLQARSDKGCESFVFNKVNVLEELRADFTFRKYKYKTDLNETIYKFDAVNPTDNATITWYLNGSEVSGGKTAYIGFGDTGTVEIQLIIENGVGCPATSKQKIFVAPPFEYFVPTAFTPNADGMNDVFKPVGDNYVIEYEFIILNRWGSRMFSTDDPDQGWDGRFTGKIAESGMYVYIIRVKDIEGQEWKYQGTFMLINPGSSF